MELNKQTYALFEEIKRKRDVLLRDSNYCLKVDNMHTTFNEAASVQSEWVEAPSLFSSIISEESDRKGIEKRVRELSRDLKDKSKQAWKYLLKNQPLSRNMNRSFLLNLGRIVTPVNVGFRYNVGAKTGFVQYVPPNDAQIYDLLTQTFDEYRSIRDPIEAALYLHLRISGIQPFGDGNKRTARILQNFTLYENKLPPAVVTLGERKHYIQMLETGLVGYRDNDPKQVSTFYNYMAGKVNTTLDQMLGLK